MAACAAFQVSVASVIIAFSFAFRMYPVKAGIKSAARIARIVRTTMSSTNVKPCFFFSDFIIIVFSIMLLIFWYHIIKMITHNIINDTVYIGKRQEKQKSL